MGDEDITRFANSSFSYSFSQLIHAASFFNHPFLNILFAIFYCLCGYFYFKAMMEDPGFVPKAGGRNGQKGVIDELLELRKFDEANFCVTCMVRRPLRSKHCKKCNRCVAKQDQYVQYLQCLLRLKLI
jgi:hypothetical protein